MRRLSCSVTPGPCLEVHVWLPAAVQTRASPQQKEPHGFSALQSFPSGGISHCVLYPVEPAPSPKSEAEAAGSVPSIQLLLCPLSHLLPGLSAFVRMAAICSQP